MQNEHEWTDRTEEGVKRTYRAIKFGGKWKFQSKLRSEERWTIHDPPAVEDLAKVHDILFRKYQRRRVPYEDVAHIESMLVAAGGTPAHD